MIEFRKNREIFEFISRKIENAKTSIKLAVAWFTDPELSKILLELKTKGVEIQIILYNDQINLLLKDLRLFQESLSFSNTLLVDYVMHHKFCIIDNECVITGSYNWTVKARRFNKENILCISDKSIVEQYISEFDALLKNSTVQTKVNIKPLATVNDVEDLQILALEKEFNQEIYSKIEETAKLKIGVNIDLAYKLVQKHTPVIAAKKLAESDSGQTIQSGLRKVTEANKLYLSFEESIIKLKYKDLFDRKTRKMAYDKLKILGFFTNEMNNREVNIYELMP